MQALTYGKYGGIDELCLASGADPEPGRGEALIQVHAASLNPFDWKLRNGMLREVIPVEFPVTPGRDGYGTVARLGAAEPGSPALAVGQPVSFICSRLDRGSLAGYAAVKARDFVVPAAANLTPEESAALPLVGLSAWNALVETAGVQPGMRVLIHGGAGGVGSAAIQVAKHLGAEVYASCRSANMDKVAMLGAEPVAYERADFVAAIPACDVVLDTVGGEVHERSCKVLRRGGTLVYLLARPFTDLSADYGVSCRQAIVLNRTGNLRHVIDLAAAGVIRPLVSHTFPLQDFRAAFRLLERGGAGGKVVLTIGAPRQG